MADLAKVKRNVAKMVDMGAPETDIDSYIASEGVTLDAVRAAAPKVSAPARGNFLDAAIGQGVLAGYGPEAKAALQAALPDMGAPDDAGLRKHLGKPEETYGERYSRMHKGFEADADNYRERHPVLSAAGEIGGAIAGVAASGGASLLPRAATTAGRLGTAAAGGAGYGAIYGSGTAEPGLENRLEGAVDGSWKGALGGAGGQALVSGGRAVIGAARNAGRAMGKLAEKPNARAVRMINEKLADDKISPKAASRMMRRAQSDPNSPNLTLMDVGEGSTVGLAQAASVTPGPGRKIINRYVDRRDAGKGKRTIGAASEALGDPNSFRQTGEQLVKQRASHGNALYGTAYANAKPVDVQPIISGIESILPHAKGSIKSTMERARGLLVRKGTMGEMPEADLESLHWTKIELDNWISTFSGDNSLGKTARGMVIKLEKQLLDAMDRSNPAYAAARQVYSDESSLMRALEMGRKFMSREVVEELPDIMQTMGAAEKKMFQQGIVRQIQQNVEDGADSADVFKRVFGSETKRKALRAVFPSEQEFAKFRNRMFRESRARQTRDIVGVRRGSRTGVVSAEQQAAGDIGEFGRGLAMDIGMGAATGGLSGGATANQAVRGFAKMLQNQNQVSPEVAEQIARIMVEEDPQAVLRLLSMGPQAARALPGPPPGIGRGVLPASAGVVAGMREQPVR